ncbi:uncharacterized protein [Pempheris klunzingeri]|uniref:uncharacterized protein isoform X1 n=1 Tax=Pempheris klunzingeri TaxID=3127111 RepID=UPI00397F19B3
MAAVGAEVAGSLCFPPPGVVGFFILLLLLSIFLTALCSNCGRRSFELREPEEKNPSALIRVVKLEEVMVVRENPMINDIQNDEKDLSPAEESVASVPSWRSHLGASQSHQDVQTNGSAAVMKTAGEEWSPEQEDAVPFTPWRSHLRAPQSQAGMNSSAPSDSDHIYHVIADGVNGGGGAYLSPPTNQEPGVRSVAAVDSSDGSSVYARVSKKVKVTTPPAHTPEEEEEKEEESSPPLPDRKTRLEG